MKNSTFQTFIARKIDFPRVDATVGVALRSAILRQRWARLQGGLCRVRAEAVPDSTLWEWSPNVTWLPTLWLSCCWVPVSTLAESQSRWTWKPYTAFQRPYNCSDKGLVIGLWEAKVLRDIKIKTIQIKCFEIDLFSGTFYVILFKDSKTAF